ncbi:hypothetical protein [Candidatus Endoriftia persephonae]|jgi:hypothetical protein|uniref:Uncharacterized protein n=2 Tax=Gammaproteobacteria TaxID=1236 RepID=G2FD75_9GAMM|nr:hypothetical protein [Candidatus Endoriftia persephone]EGW55161.1 hypothetical protein TevJSym_ae00180 [endosymbiont of Tevnia jerichonana (vent Tica)]USF88752.1 hypothetical protein L0Y14_05835 [Candidatus Endoriftia persephone]
MLNQAPLNAHSLNSAAGNGGLNEGEAVLLLEQISAEAGSGVLLLEQVSAEPGIATLLLEQISTGQTGAAYLPLQQISAEVGEADLLLEQNSVQNTGPATLRLQQASIVEAAPTLYLQQASVEDAAVSLWRLFAVVDGVDISANLTGSWSVDAEEGAARVAQITVVPPAGPIDPLDWVRRNITLHYASVDAAGVPRWSALLFAGIVDVPEYDPNTRLLTLSCTDQLQERFERMDAAGVEATVGGYYSPVIFDETADGWQQAQDRLSTQQAAYDLDVSGTGRLTDWVPKATADFSHASADHIDGTRQLELADGRALVNQVTINFDFRFQRLRQRDYQYNWQMNPPIGCEYLYNPFVLPTRAMIKSAAEATGWAVQSVGYVDLPPPQFFTCYKGGAASQIGWGISLQNTFYGTVAVADPDLALLCQGAYIKLSKRWAQTITETYSITVRSDRSVSQNGTIGAELSGSLEAEADTDTWEQDSRFTGLSVGATAAPNGDWSKDAVTGEADGRAALESALETLQARARASIAASHRHNYVSWQVPLSAQIDRHQTGEISTPGLTAKGKVFQVVHSGDIGTGEAVTDITIALSRTGGTGANNDDLPQAPPAPDTEADPAANQGPAVLTAGNAGMHIGGTQGAPPFSDDRAGFVTNYQYDSNRTDWFDPEAPGSVVYPVQFRVPTPEIEDEARQAKQAMQEQTLNVAVRVDQLSIT